MKNISKSIFVSVFPVVALALMVLTVLHLIDHGMSYRYMGRLLTASTVVIFFLGLFVKPVARTEAIPKWYTLGIVLGFLTSVIDGGIIQQDILGSFPTIGLFLGWVLYLKWFSVFPKRTENKILKAGHQLPELTFIDTDGQAIKTTSFIGKPAIYLFYRGNWCPLCMAQIAEIASQYKALEARGVTVALISSQPHKYTQRLAKKFDVNFKFLLDTDNTIAQQLQIAVSNGIPMGFQVFGYRSETAMPTVIITDASGTILFVDLTDNYRVRPEPQTFLDILDAHKLAKNRPTKN